MNRIILFLTVSFLSAYPIPRFELNISNGLWEKTYSLDEFPQSNGIIDIESNDNIYTDSPGSLRIWITTGDGLGFAYENEDNIVFEGISDPSLPLGGNPALFIKDDIIVVSGVTQEYIAATSSYEPKGAGIGYSVDYGETWEYIPQPVCEDCSLYQNIQWGSQELVSLAVTTEINNISYDIGMKDEYIYAASWAGGLQRFDYNNPVWEPIPLPMDNQDSLICNSIFEEDYLLNPRDPSDGGNHNHKGFSVLGTDDYLWVGTAKGINRGTINNDCINWYHQTTENGLSGDWVIGIEEQVDTPNRIWAITWSAGAGQSNSIAYTENDGYTWTNIQYFSERNIKVYNLDFNDATVYAASEEGLFYSQDLVHWEKVETVWVDSYTGDIILDNHVYSVFYAEHTDAPPLSQNPEHILFIGTGDGLVQRDNENNNRVYRFWNNHASSNSQDLGFSVYPNPFFINEHGLLNEQGHVRFIYYNPDNQNSHIDIFNFNMHHVAKLTDKINIDNESIHIWSPCNIINGTYFCRLSINNKVYWTKLVIIN